MLFDRQLVLLGPSAYVILDNFGRGGYMPGRWSTLVCWGYSVHG